MSFITLNHGVSFIFGWTGYPSVEKQGMPFVNIKEGKKTRVIITSQISSSRYPYFRFVYQLFTGIMMDSNIQEKVHKVEEFFDGHLKPQLVRAIAERDKVFEQQKMLFVKEHRELREEQRTMVNLGSVLYMQVDVPDTHRIFVDVGLGFHVEFTWQKVGACQIILLFEHFAWPRLQLIGINPDEPLGGDAGIGLCFIVI
ncbi:hypothetical protein D5086_020324 [Populus alba]|uniref:Uncharacterized protein n=1 Tax=Populus alba TaxID=43335 RepID=A0ACC4BJU0_POPAL